MCYLPATYWLQNSTKSLCKNGLDFHDAKYNFAFVTFFVAHHHWYKLFIKFALCAKIDLDFHAYNFALVVFFFSVISFLLCSV